MKNIIGKAKIAREATFRTGLRIYLSKAFTDIVGNEIVFNFKDMTIRRPTIDSRHTYAIKTRQFYYHLDYNDIEEYVGRYVVIQKDEDTFKLKKIKDHAR